MEFRPCPSFPGHSVSLSGVLRRDARKSGKPLRVYRERVFVGGVSVRLDRVVYDAWRDEAPLPRGYDRNPSNIKKPGVNRVKMEDGSIIRSSYNDGRILTVGEWRKVMMETEG